MLRPLALLVLTTLFLAKPIPAQGSIANTYGGCYDAFRPMYLTRPYLSGPDVADIQKRLLALGFYHGPINGLFDPATTSAIKKLQIAHNAPATGRVELETYELMGTEPEPAAATPTETRPTGKPKLLIDISRHTLTLLYGEVPFKTYPVCVGTPETPTPVGEWQVAHKDSEWGNGFGSRWMGLNVPWGTYGIHGTNKPWSIGGAESHGCIRMFNRDVEDVYPEIGIGTVVKIVGKPELPPAVPRHQIKLGVNGPDVVQVQLRLKEMGLYWGLADGRYGIHTKLAVIYWQNLMGLQATGELEPKIKEQLTAPIQNKAG